MNIFLPGAVSELDNIDAGSFVLFNMPDGLHAGLVINDGNNSKAILDFEGEDKHGKKRFMIYQGHHFGQESILNLHHSRIVPDLAADSLAYGMHSAGLGAKALYLSQGRTIVLGGLEHYTYKIDLQTGTIVQADFAYLIHANRWRIEVEDGAGNFDVLREIGE